VMSGGIDLDARPDSAGRLHTGEPRIGTDALALVGPNGLELRRRGFAPSLAYQNSRTGPLCPMAYLALSNHRMAARAMTDSTSVALILLHALSVGRESAR
jgi:hypothetical protein